MNVTVRAEDIMTPRHLLEHRARDAEAEKVANVMGFDAIPISRPDGRVREFWSRPDRQRIRIRRMHRAAHDAPIESLLLPLGAHLIQFVYYGSEVVGLIDASDLNKPMARIGWLHPMLELERSVLDAARALKISDEEQAMALGRKATAGARKRQGRAKRQDLELPLLEYAQFAELLCAGAKLHLHDLDDVAIDELNTVRKRAAHSGDIVVENRDDCFRISRALTVARRVARQIQALRRRRRI
jgi:hypothetical protein